MPDETKVREFLDLPGLESYDGAMKDYVDKANKTLTTAVNVLEASKLDIQVQQSLSDEAKALGRTNLGAASKTEFDDHTANKENPHEVTKAQVGLGNVDDTSDANKPVSTAQATAIADAKKAGTDAQSNLTAHKNAENPHSITPAMIGLGNVNDTADADKPVSTAQAAAIADAISAIPQSDWDVNDELNPAFIKNRPFYSGEMSEVEIVSYEIRTGTDIGEGAIRFEIMGVSLANGTPGSFKVGQEYIVTIDGVRYVTVAKYGENFNYIGNEETMNTGVFPEETPFFAYGADADMSMSGEPYIVFLMPTSDGSLEHAWGITTFEENVKTIDTKYLPEHLQFGETGKVTITTVLPYEEREFYYNAEEMGEVALYTDESFVPFEEGKVYHVTINGVEYTCQSFCDVDNFGPMIILGSVELLMEGTAPDELPFCSYSMTGDDGSIFAFGFKSTSGGVHSFGIEVEETEIVKIDQKYLPDMGGDVILFDIGDEIGAEDGYEYCNITCNYTYEELDALLTNVANASDLSAYPSIKLRRRWNDSESVTIPMDYYDRNRGNYRFFFSFIADSYISNYFVNYGRDGTANAILKGTDLDDDFVAFPKKSPEGTPIVDYGISGQVLASTGNKKVEWKSVSELVSEQLDSKQNKTLIVTGTCAELEGPNSEVELTLSHTWNDINTALSNNQDVEIHVDMGNTGMSVIVLKVAHYMPNAMAIFSCMVGQTLFTTSLSASGETPYLGGMAIALMAETEAALEEKQDKITGTAGDFVVIGEDGNVTTKTIPYAEEATF